MTDTRHRLDLYLRHRTALIDYAAPIVGDRSNAEDVVQEAWLRFAARDDDSTGGSVIAQPVGYLYRVVRNLAIDLSRRIAPEVKGEEGEAALGALPSLAADPEDQALQRNELDVVLAALGELPDRTRRAFHMHRFEGRTYSEIALALGVSAGTAHRLVSDAVAHCMSRVLDNGR